MPTDGKSELTPAQRVCYAWLLDQARKCNEARVEAERAKPGG